MVVQITTTRFTLWQLGPAWRRSGTGLRPSRQRAGNTGRAAAHWRPRSSALARQPREGDGWELGRPPICLGVSDEAGVRDRRSGVRRLRRCGSSRSCPRATRPARSWSTSACQPILRDPVPTPRPSSFNLPPRVDSAAAPRHAERLAALMGTYGPLTVPGHGFVTGLTVASHDHRIDPNSATLGSTPLPRNPRLFYLRAPPGSRRRRSGYSVCSSRVAPSSASSA